MIKLVSQSLALVVVLSSGSSWGSQEESKKSSVLSRFATVVGLHRWGPTIVRQPLSFIKRLLRPGSGHGSLVEAPRSRGVVDRALTRATTAQTSQGTEVVLAKQTPKVARGVLALERVALEIGQESDRPAADSDVHEARQRALDGACMDLVRAITAELDVQHLFGLDAAPTRDLWVAHERARQAVFGALGVAIDRRLDVGMVSLILPYLVTPLSMSGQSGRDALRHSFVDPLRRLVERMEESPWPGDPGSSEHVKRDDYLKSLERLEREVLGSLPEPERPPR